MLTPSNGISLLRAPLAFLLLIDNPVLRVVIIVAAMITDCIDGYLARRYRFASQFGAILDPLMDKFFVYFAIGVLFMNQKIQIWQAVAMVSRDFFLCIFAVYLIINGTWSSYRFRSIRWGKVSTAAQFLVLIALVSGLQVSNYVYYGFIAVGTLAFIELLRISKISSSN